VNAITGFFDTIQKGGPAMWMLLVLSVAAVAIVIERLLFFASQHSDSKGLLRSIGQKISADDLPGAIKLCRQNKGVIGTIAVIAPFVGLFGTVLGIIRAFEDIALKGNSTPAVVAAGVSEALITTAAGLFVAVIAVIFFNYFKTRIKAYNQEMIVAANQLAEMLHFHNTGTPIPTDLYQPGTTGATK